jgi:hypothetical protein
MSTKHCPLAVFTLTLRFSTLVVGGNEFSGISSSQYTLNNYSIPTKVVTPPAAAALVAVQNPSQAVRPLR